MRRLTPIFALTALSFGCAATERATVLLPSFTATGGPNLLLHPTLRLTHLSESYAGRSTWPSVEHGLILEDTTYVSEWSYDDESFTDRLGGGYYGVREGYRLRRFAR